MPVLVLRTPLAGEHREGAVRLLSRAGRSAAYVREACAAGTVFALVDIAGDPDLDPHGAAVSVALDRRHAVELRLAAISQATPDAGRKLIDQFADMMRAAGTTHVVAAASNAELGFMSILQAGGFRFLQVERDACGPDRGFSAGDGHRDLVWMDLEL